MTVAAGASQLGMKTVLIEKEPRLGGDCLHYGCVPSKTLIKSAKVYHAMRRAESFGLPAVELPPVDFSRVTQRIRTVIDAIQQHDSEERFCGLGVKVVFGQASFIDEHQLECDGSRYSAKFWVLATGSHPSPPPIPGLDTVPYWTNMDLFSLQKLPSSLIVLGGGPIGCEMAQAFARLGSRVTLVQRSGQLLSVEDEDMAEVVQDRLRAEGIVLELNASTSAVRSTDSGIALDFERDGEKRTVEGRHLLVAAGRAPSVEGLGLEQCGVEYDRRGVEVDRRLRTSQSHIFAAGDVLGKHQFTHAAGYEGSVVISNTVFRLPKKVDYTWLPWCTYTEPELASIGMNEKRARAEGIEHTVWIEEFADNDRARAEGEPDGRLKLVLNSRGKPLGVQIVGLHAGELGSEWVAALNGNVGLSTMASSIHCYPTLSEVNKRVAGRVLSKKLFSGTVRKTLSFIFDYKGRACSLD